MRNFKMWIAVFGCQIAMVMVLDSCQLPIGEACGDGWCPVGQFCVNHHSEHPVCESSSSTVTAELIAGDIGGSGSVDGTGAAARFNTPYDVTVDDSGNVYVVEEMNSTLRKITPAGEVVTLAGAARVVGSADGTGPDARFNWPTGVAVDKANNIYIADRLNHTIRKVTPAGTVTTVAGVADSPGFRDGVGTVARFNYPYDVAVDRNGNVFILDGSNAAIRELDSSGNVTTLAWGSLAGFDNLGGLAVDHTGNIYITDISNFDIRKMTPAGVVTTLAGRGVRGVHDGTGSDAQFGEPTGVTVDTMDNAYVADSLEDTIRKVTPAGEVTTLAGLGGSSGNVDGTGTAARFHSPIGVALDSAGNLFIADYNNGTIRKMTPNGIVTTLAGAVLKPGSNDGTTMEARFNMPAGVVVDADDGVFIVDQGNATIRKITPADVVTTLAGAAGIAGSADGTGAVVRFNSPTGAAIDAAGTIYIADKLNHTIRKLTRNGVVVTLAGTAGMVGSADGMGPAARFSSPTGVAVDSSGAVYVADSGNHTIRKITADGTVSTLAGTAGTSGHADGPAALFNVPSGVAVDSAGNVYVADTGNNTIRKIATDGMVSTPAGTVGISGAVDGSGSAAQFSTPTAMVLDSAGNLYVIDSGNSTIRKIRPDGATTTIAGTAHRVGIALGEHPGLAAPSGLAVFGDSLIVTDTNAILLLHHAVQP